MNGMSLLIKKDFLMDLSKIIIIIISGVYLLGNFTPFFEANDGFLYGIEAINLSNGVYTISNELLEDTGRFEFVGENWRKTIHGDAVPSAGIGTPILGALSYLIGGNYGLFYLGPILGILFLIIYERISTKLFGKYVGLLSLIFLATCHIFFRSAVLLNTDAILTLFFIPGAYYLIKFFKNKNEKYVFLASIFFVIATLVKVTGIVFFPIELILIGGYFVFSERKKIFLKNNTINQNKIQLIISKINKKKILKIVICVTIPWIIYFSFLFISNDYYYGDVSESYFTNKQGKINPSSGTLVSSLLTFEQRDFDQFKDFSKYLLPYQISAIYNKSTENLDDLFGKNWPGLLSPLIILAALLVSLKEKHMRIEIIVMSFFIVGIIWFFSGQHTEERAAAGLPARWMLPGLSLSLMMLSYLVVRFFQSKNSDRFINQKISKIFKKIMLIGLGLFFIIAFYFSPPTQIFVSDEIHFKNSQIYAEKYPPNLEGIKTNSVIVSIHQDFALAYNAIPFHLDGPNGVNPKAAKLLKEIISDGYGVYTLKENKWAHIEKEMWNELVEDYQIILKDNSVSFCKMYNAEDVSGKSDSICFNNNKK
jgi:hypothetical protein